VLFLTGPKWRTSARGGCSLLPSDGCKRRERRANRTSCLLSPISPLPLSSAALAPGSTRFHNSWAPLTPDFPKTHPQIKHAHRPFFLFRVRLPLLRCNPALLLPRQPPRPSPDARILPRIHPCWATLNRPSPFLKVSTHGSYLTFLGKWEQC